MDYTMPVVEVESGREHRLPADAVTRDTPPPACASRPGDGRAASQGPLLPLAFRPRGDAFFVTSPRWPELAGKALRLQASRPVEAPSR
jgi:hypothetical protein